MAELPLLGALLLGLLGSGHCAGMCGGIGTALVSALPNARRESALRRFGFTVAYNVGRVGSYVIAGVIASQLGVMLLQAIGHDRAHALSGLLSGLVFIALGLYLTGWWRGLAALERLGQRLWRRIEPLGRRLLPVDSVPKAILAGMVWGWLPCGLVYAALLIAVTRADPLAAASFMLVFGLGTLPMMLSIGLAGLQLQRLRQHPVTRIGAGVFMLVVGVAVSLGLIDFGALHDSRAHHH